AVVDAVAHDSRDREELGRHPLIVKASARGLKVLPKIARRRVARVVTLRVDGQGRATVGRLELAAYAPVGGPIGRRENGARNVEPRPVFQLDKDGPFGIAGEPGRRYCGERALQRLD